MKKILGILFGLLIVLSLNACDDDSPEKADPTGGDPLASYTSTPLVDVDPSWEGTPESLVDTDGWSLDQFVSQDDVDALMGNPTSSDVRIDTRAMYSVNLTGSDGYMPRSKGALSMPWEIFKTGYLLPKVYDAKAYWYEATATRLQKYWLVKGVKYVDLCRSLVFYITDTAEAAEDEEADRYISFEVSTLTTASLTYWNWNGDEEQTADAIKLSDLLTAYVTTDDPSLYNYTFAAADGYVSDGTGGTLTDNTCDYATFDMAYYIPGADNNEKIVFIDSTDDNHQEYKSVKWIVSIELVPLTGATGDYDGTTAPTFATTPEYSTEIPQQ